MRAIFLVVRSRDLQGKDSDYAGQRTLKLRKENAEILTKKLRRRES